MGRLNSRESDPTENQTAVGATKTEVVFQGVVNFDITRRVGAVIEIALGVLIV